MSSVNKLLVLMMISSLCCVPAECNRPCFARYCWCQDVIADCSGNGRALDTIPTINIQDIEVLYFANNYLPNIAEHTFAPVKKFNLKFLDLRGNEIRSIAKNGFSFLSKMLTLHLSKNTIPPKTIEGALQSLPKRFSYLYLNHMNLRKISASLFRGLHHTIVTGIHLSHNRLDEVNMTAFKDMRYITTISLEYSGIRSLGLVPLGQLRTLWLTSNNLTTFPKLCPKNKALFPQLWTLGLHNNSLTSLNSSDFNCLTNLRHVFLSGNNFPAILGETFSTLTNLKTLDVSGNAGPLLLADNSFNNLNLRYLNLTSSKLLSVRPTSFNNCVSLESLDLSNTSRNIPYTKYLTSILHGLTLRTFRCSMCGLTAIPPFVSTMISLQSLDLGENEIDNVPDHSFDKNINLKNLSLYKNKLRSFNSVGVVASIRYGLTCVNFKENPFDCSCKLLWLKKWILHDKLLFRGQEVNYTCASPDQDRGKRIVDVPDLGDKRCLIEDSPFISTVCVVGSVFGSLIILALLYKWRWTIRYNYMKRQIKMSASSPEEGTALLQADVYVVYSDDDYSWVRHEAMPNTEELGCLRLIVRQRDFFQKKHVINNIVESLNCCRTVLVVMSNSFVRDKGCRFELSLVQKRFEDQLQALVVVLLEDIENRYMSASMSSFLQSTTVFTWSTDLVNIDTFWGSLLAVLRD
ncbi:toll-like receptor 3 [Haliotis asinina]|uniref:toll-like receptor 3 n=1 Tax=Haliotis asinina TaxID=109174 RepID=UPI0035318D72